MPLLWHLVPAKRMWFSCGLLIFLLALMILRGAPLRVTWPRLTAFSACVFLSWIGSEMWLNAAPQWGNHEDLWILLPLMAVVLFRRRLAASLRPALIGCAALANLLAFGLFNPIQSALPIFAPPKAVEEAKLAFDRVAQRHPRGWLVLPESWGASLNGLGYKSVAHILLAPETEWFRPWFPELAEETLDEVFNRTTYPVLTLRLQPSTNDETDLRLPVDVFDPPTVDIDIVPLPFDGGEVRGQVERRDLFEANGSLTVALAGWGNFDGSDSTTRLTVYTNLPVERAVAYPAMRSGTAESLDEPGLVVSGLALRLELRQPAGGNAALRRLVEITPICVVSEDPVRGRFLLHPARFPPAACTAGG